MNLYNEAKAIASEAIKELGTDNIDELDQFIYESCDSNEVVIYPHKGIKFCSEQDTSEGEYWLEDCGGIVQPGDSFGDIACRIAFETLYCASREALDDMLKDVGE